VTYHVLKSVSAALSLSSLIAVYQSYFCFDLRKKNFASSILCLPNTTSLVSISIKAVHMQPRPPRLAKVDV
jgi:hypothetical protein